MRAIVEVATAAAIAFTATCARAEQVVVGAETRSFALHIPAIVAAAKKSAPVVVVLHGGRGTGVQMRAWSGMDRVADRHGFIAVYPDGLGKQWNDGRVGVGKADDVAFLTTIVSSLVSRGLGDKERAFVTGASNGGMMTFRLACETTGVFAGYAAVIANLTDTLADKCAPKSPTRMMLIFGTEDTFVPYRGGAVIGDRGKVISADATIAFWAGRAGCTPGGKTRLPDTDPNDGMVTDVSRCADDRVVAYTITGGGHQWPSTTRAARPLIDRMLGPSTRDFEASEHIWSFFEKAPATP